MKLSQTQQRVLDFVTSNTPCLIDRGLLPSALALEKKGLILLGPPITVLHSFYKKYWVDKKKVNSHTVRMASLPSL